MKRLLHIAVLLGCSDATKPPATEHEFKTSCVTIIHERCPFVLCMRSSASGSGIAMAPLSQCEVTP